MQEVECLNDLIRILGKDKVELLFTEYIMYLVAKADKLDAIVNNINTGGNVNSIKSILDGC